MRGTSKPKSRGHILAMVLLFVALLATIATLLLSSAQYAASGTRAMEQKNGTLDAAEAGLNAALDALDLSLAALTSRGARLPNGYHYSYKIYPNFTGLQSLFITDPITGNGHIALPAIGAVIVSTGTGPNGERPTTVEAAVTADITQLTYPHDAIVTGLSIQGSYGDAVTDSTGMKAAIVHANGNITARVSGGVQGSTEASGSTNSLRPGTTHAAQVPLPTVSQFDYMVASYKNQASVFNGPTNVYVPAGGRLAPSYTCGASGPISAITSLITGCLLFYDGPLDLTTEHITLTGPWTMVVNGKYQQSGPASLMFVGHPALLVVNGNAYLRGSGALTAYLEVKGSTELGGDTAFTGAHMSLGSLSFKGGGIGKFVYDPSVIPPLRVMTGLVKIETYAEY